MENFDGKTVMISGGAQGIGKAISSLLLSCQAKVMIADIDTEAGNETVEELKAAGEIRFVRTDIADEQSVGNAVHSCIESFGRLDGLVNDAAIVNASGTPIEKIPVEEWNRVIGVNLTGTMLCVKHCAPHIRKTHGAIVNIASTRALMSEPHCEAYAASKGGVVALTHALALSLGPDVRVNCICPGWIDTSPWKKSSKRTKTQWSQEDHKQHPVGRVGEPMDIAQLAVFLLSENAGFITGQNFVADGGMTKKMIYV